MSRDELRRVFDQLGLHGSHVVVHADVAALGTFENAALALCELLINAVGPNGTLVIPTFTHSETISEAPRLRRAAPPMPSRAVPYHADLAPSADLGPVPEIFRHLPGVMRSNHPTHSFAAWGRQAREVLSTQRDSNPLGPLKKLNVLQGHILLFGTGLDAAVAIHLAEETSGAPYLGRRTALRINAGGFEERVVVENFPGCSAAFVKLEAMLDPTKVRSAALPAGVARKLPVRYLVNLASQALENDPGVFICDTPGCVSCAGKREALGLPLRAKA